MANTESNDNTQSAQPTSSTLMPSMEGECSQQSFGVTNKSRITFLISELQRTKKGSMIVDQYLNTVKQLADNLEIAGKTVLHGDFVTQVLAGLDKDYTPIVVQINSRESISWHQLQSVLMIYESRIEYLNAVKNNLALET
ncbi:unnamed protein product [Fraxinus pennsylvanica]|uniref:Uncharacterized protein n=1 Tax=Fraxinus pennsylvanica TaxID=56036 RepID=A0AAD2A7R2_9LAMI|nr:unnamed protein product [Fraxinus pennsylvanica]